MLTLALIVYIPAFYATEVGISLTDVGLVFMAARTFDALLDPLVGYLSDITRTPLGSRKPWLLVGAPLLLISTWQLFLPPEQGVSMGYLLLWIFCFYLAWTIVQIPYLSWGAELSTDYEERNRIVGYREGMLFIGTLLATALPTLVFLNEEPSIRSILYVFALLSLLILPVAVVLAIRNVPVTAPISENRAPLGQAMQVIGQNKPFLLLMLGCLLAWLALHIYNAAVLLIIEFALKFEKSIFLQLVFIQFFIGLLAVPLITKAASRFGKHKVLSASLLSCALALPLMSIVPEASFVHAVIMFALLGICISPIWILPTAIVADAVDYGRQLGGSDQSGLYISLYNLCNKLALAASVGIALPIIQYFGFDTLNAATHDNISPLFSVGLYLPSLIFVPASIVLWRYPIGKKEHQQIVESLKPGAH